VFVDVGQRFAGDPEQLELDVGGQRADVDDLDADPHAGVGGELPGQDPEGFAERPVFERRRAERGDGSPCFVDPHVRHIQRPKQRRRRGGARFETRQRRLDLQRDSREALRERVVDVARDACTLVGPRALDGLLAQARPLDRHTDLVRDRRQQIQLLTCQPPPVPHREVHHAERTIPGVERHARMAAQALRLGRPRRFHGWREPAALDHVDIARGQLAALKELQAPARSAGHPDRLLQVRRQILYGGAVEAVRLRIAEPDPTGLHAEEIRHAGKRFAGRPLLRRGAVERFGDLLEDPQRPRGGETHLQSLIPHP
jgi:hypothetical protein